MKIVALFGSPRPKGNTATLAQAFVDTARSLGAEVDSFMLNTLDIKGCQACDACKTLTDRCIVNDELSEVLNAVGEADVLVAATPIYFADVTAQFKMFVDRCYSYLKPFESIPEESRLEPGKTFVLITAQNREEEVHGDICTKYMMIFEFLGFNETYLVRGCELMAADAIETKNRLDLMDQAREIAKKVVLSQA